MPPFKEQTFQDRAAKVAETKRIALERLRAKPPVDEAVIAERKAAALAREEARAIASAERKEALEREKAERKARAAEALLKKAPAPTLTPEEKKAARDAKYAARKLRVGRG